MKVIMAERVHIYGLLSLLFRVEGTSPRIAEVGVLRGENAEQLHTQLSPQHMYLVDAWSPVPGTAYQATNDHRSWVNKNNDYSYYYGGDLELQSTFDRLYETTVARFQGADNVTVIRENARDGFKTLRDDHLQGDVLDLAYIDAAHAFEDVFDDLMSYSNLLSDNGMIQLNDCCFSPEGIAQNLGVLEATTRFCKMTDFTPVLATNTDWTDVLLIKRHSSRVALMDELVLANDIPFVEVPDQLLGALHVRYGKRRNVSFV